MNRPEIIYEDDHIIVVNKPAGIFTIGERFNPTGENLKSILEPKYGKLFVVHRIDKDTSGLVIFAKDAESHRDLSMQFEHREVEKYYLAIVDGNPSPAEGEIDAPLAESTVTRGKMLIHKRGKDAKSKYEIVESFRDFSLVKVRIFTGRLHQVRVHMASVGHPLMIDSLYGKRSEFYVSEIKGRKYNPGKYQDEKPMVDRLTLHAYRLSITHPVTGEKMSFEAELPKDMNAILNQLRKWNMVK
ncbi:MAG TPA: RluA family pseudouridine synthase [Saprospiraceae bacterium]|nr:RluA family pseudouridine synthase [Saprospiraceae bacterium]MCB9327672.1 RluA family pseudouridine synthase [Lewinellaceae bacterium]HPQ22622.1 RluA family pseudouridine synthase [Saprospiraceae bacterium]